MGYGRYVAAPLLSRAALLIALVSASFVPEEAFAQDAAPAAPAPPAAAAAAAAAPAVDALSTPPAQEGPPAEAAPVTQTPKPSPVLPGKYLAVGGLALGAGVVYFVSALFDSFATDAHSDATTLAQNRACGAGPSCSAFDDKRNDASHDRTVSGVLLGVGSVVAVGAMAAWIFWPEDEGSKPQDDNGKGPGSAGQRSSLLSSPWVAPSVGPQGASLTAGVRF